MDVTEPTEEPPNETTGERLERLFAKHMLESRERQGMSQAALARRLYDEFGIKLDSSGITRIERHAKRAEGARSLRLTEALAIAKILGEDINRMLQPSVSLKERRSRVFAELEDAISAVEAAEAHRDRIRDELRSIDSEIERQEQQRTAEQQLKEAEQEVERLRQQAGYTNPQGNDPATTQQGRPVFVPPTETTSRKVFVSPPVTTSVFVSETETSSRSRDER